MTFFKLRENDHKHVFTVKLDRALGYWQKRDCPGDGVYFGGQVEECRGCAQMRFVPADPRLQTVECER